MKKTVPFRALAVAVLAGTLLLPEAAEAARPKPRPLKVPVHAYVLSDGSPGEACDEPCLKRVLSTVRRRRGVRSASIVGSEIQLEIVPGVFKAETVIQNVVGFKVEMRLPYKHIEMRFVPSAPFPPAAFVEEDALVVELGEDVRSAIDEALRFKLPVRLKCVGKVSGPQANEATLVRYEQEKRPPVSTVPFIAEADLDGDRRPDMYLRVAGLPEMVVFNKAGGLKAVPIERTGAIDEIPRCEQSPLRFARGITKKKIKCMGDTPPHAGDAIERVEHNRSNQLLMWSKGGFATCEPLGEGALPDATAIEGDGSE